jgi:hypothetical protein
VEKRSEDSKVEPWKTEDIFRSDSPRVSPKPAPVRDDDSDSDDEDEDMSYEEMDSLRRELFPPLYDLDFDEDSHRTPNAALIVGWVAALTMIVSGILSVFFFPLIAITMVSMFVFIADYIIFGTM